MDRRCDKETANRSGSGGGGGNNDGSRKSFGISVAGLATRAASLALGTSNGSGTDRQGSDSTSFSSDKGSHSRFTCPLTNGGCAGGDLSTRFFLSGGSCNRISKADRLLTVSRFNGSFCCCCCVVMVNSPTLHIVGVSDNNGSAGGGGGGDGVVAETVPQTVTFSALIWWIVVPSGNLMAEVVSIVGNEIFTSLINAGSCSIISSARSILALVCSSSSSSSLLIVSTKSIELSFRSTSIGSTGSSRTFGVSLTSLTSICPLTDERD